MKKAFLFFVVALSSLSAYSQNEDYKFYSYYGGGGMVLYRGHKAMDFRVAHNGTQYWFDSQFREGTVYYNGKIYEKVRLNIDAFNQDLVIKDPEGLTNILLVREKVKWLTIGDAKFYNLQAMGYESALPGYYQVLFDGKDKFVVRIVKTLEQDLDGHIWQSMGQGDYKAGVHETFLPNRSFYLVKADGQFEKVSNKTAFLKQYREQKKELKKYMESNAALKALKMPDYAVEALKHLEEK